jgi:peptidoglycan/xylan/chitin deacetylase (PgdA/CDA1 family)
MINSGAMSAQSVRRTVAVLAFHKIGEPPATAPRNARPWYIPEGVFRSYLRHLSSSGWEVISADTFLKALSAPESLPQRSALLTFDDAYKSLLDSASRCLREFAYPAVVFTPTKFVGGTNSFDRANQPVEPICTWDDLRELEKRGFSIQSHGVKHESFRNLDLEQQEQELRESKISIETELKKSVELFAYPFGRAPGNRRTLSELLERLGYRAAFGFGGNPARFPMKHSFFLPRVDVFPDTDLDSRLGSRYERILSLFRGQRAPG